ncbi:MAG: hypothetical protein AVDCRST_MAG35-3119 [uncultured Quadrisphaera sp.]|uniref:Uncharacterized protein n=1 Tax=uncultured Quadrisphaera sp. TaxID=904978 RepID=A0A6J4QIZ0_9ACTN|nr:MAG: hypothetical protein AVDCRST_MAG35-3119 [uncultured Quadrisphaera sp.]
MRRRRRDLRRSRPGGASTPHRAAVHSCSGVEVVERVPPHAARAGRRPAVDAGRRRPAA